MIDESGYAEEAGRGSFVAKLTCGAMLLGVLALNNNKQISDAGSFAAKFEDKAAANKKHMQRMQTDAARFTELMLYKAAFEHYLKTQTKHGETPELKKLIDKTKEKFRQIAGYEITEEFNSASKQPAISK